MFLVLKMASKRHLYTEHLDSVSPIFVGLNQWLKGSLVGKGGMCNVYNAKSLSGVEGNFVMKLGPGKHIYYEQSVFRKILKTSEIDKWEHDVGPVFLPRFIDAGRLAETDVYFIIMDKLEKIETGFPIGTELLIKMMTSIVYSLEYMHSLGFAHCDIKLENLLQKDGIVYLVDFTISYKHSSAHHQKVKRDAFVDGTLEYAGLDMHKTGHGPSPRADLHNIIFCLVEWCGGILPWKNIKDIEHVKSLKEKFLANKDYRNGILSRCSKFGLIIGALVNHAQTLSLSAVPNYKYIRSLIDSMKTLS